MLARRSQLEMLRGSPVAAPHAQEAGEYVATLGGHPSLGIGKLLEAHPRDIGDMLRESLAHEHAARLLYEQLLDLVAGKNVMLEEYARRLIAEESLHASEVEKMLRPPAS